MSGDSSDQARSTAVKHPKALGLSTYAVRTFVALVSLGKRTAQDVGEVADVPRTRVHQDGHNNAIQTRDEWLQKELSGGILFPAGSLSTQSVIHNVP
ncbi:helix-turn-helix domain-containing protein [Halobellus salinisoli]|uniref:helix-turn-helix domain-containing protein n=1 Tax=Halobellus salinisoli TaxID=3108500 RepID=UPI003009F625